jgi:hypothetical protein
LPAVRIDFYSNSAFPTAHATTLLQTRDRPRDLQESDACHLVIPVDIAKHIILVELMVNAKAMIGYRSIPQDLTILASVDMVAAGTSASASGCLASLGRR